ncbi:MAG TPA: histidine--tRNA ligase [Armatimonadota bacterium]|nr:histidine--tRNA ligase [Armatimonadota bacterium]
MKFRAPRGTQDILPEDAPRWRYVEGTFRRTCADFGYEELRTPMFEQTELFVRAVGEHTDIVSKEMYTVSAGTGEDRETYTLRPEGTAPALRAYIQHSLGAKSPLTKLYYIAPNFRHERPQSGRLRQHHQTGIEALGSEDPALDAEVIVLGLSYLRRLGITGERLELNSVGCPQCRPRHREALLAALKERIGDMCENCQRRYQTNPLRILDCKVEDWSKLEPVIPDIVDYLCESCGTHFAAVQETLRALGVEYHRNKRLVRGLDYYVKTSFEITHGGLGAQSTVLGGGRYDGLVEELGGEPTPGIGFGCGIERVLLICDALGIRFPVEEPRPVFVVTLGEAARLPGLKLLNALRQAGVPAQIDYQGRSMKAQMRAANRAHARVALILGEDEVAQGVVSLKDLDSSSQETVPMDEVIPRLASR